MILFLLFCDDTTIKQPNFNVQCFIYKERIHVKCTHTDTHSFIQRYTVSFTEIRCKNTCNIVSNPFIRRNGWNKDRIKNIVYIFFSVLVTIAKTWTPDVGWPLSNCWMRKLVTKLMPNWYNNKVGGMS